MVIDRDGEEVAIPDVAVVVILRGDGLAALYHYRSADSANFFALHCCRPVAGNDDLDAEAFALVQKHFPQDIGTGYDYHYTCPADLAARFRERTG